jgi:hypothetical protein
MPDKVYLKELEIGDRFIPARHYHKRKPIYQVIDKPVFNRAHGSSTRMCRDVITGKPESKSCKLEVVKLNK